VKFFMSEAQQHRIGVEIPKKSVLPRFLEVIKLNPTCVEEFFRHASKARLLLS
jgi:hypothetical protein